MTSSAIVNAWWDRPADGRANMAADLALAVEAERRGGLVLRCYGWSEPTVSLGAFQPLAAREADACVAGLAVVRRPSGGGAIVHGTDLTYAAAVPRGHAWAASPQLLYEAIHGAMVAALADRGVVAGLFEPAERHAGVETGDTFLCFDRRAAGDVVSEPVGRPAAGAPKIMGSAQRRLAGAVLQHGSLLLRANPAVRSASSHAGIAELHGASAAERPQLLAADWIAHLARRLGTPAAWHENFAAGVDPAELAAAAARFSDSRWLRRY